MPITLPGIRLLPRSLVSRVFALYGLSLSVFLLAALGLFLVDQFGRRLDESFTNAEALASVLQPALADSAVIGDYDTIEKALERAAANSDFVSVSFIDLKGGVLRADHAQTDPLWAPLWLQRLVSERLFDINQPVVVGGSDYGVLRIRFSALLIASQLWQKAVYAMALGFSSLVVGLLLIFWPLRHWLGDLDRLRDYEQEIQEGSVRAEQMLSGDAPLEIRQTFEVLGRAARSLQVQRERAAVTLSAIAEGVLTLDAQGQVLLANPTALQMLGLAEEQVIGRSMRALMPEMFPDGRADLHPWRGWRLQVARGDRPVLVLESSMLVIRDAGQQPVAHVLTARDVTEQQALDERLRAELRSREQAMTSLRGLLEGLSQHWQGAVPGASNDDIGAISDLIAGLVDRMQERSDQLNAIFALSPDGFVSFDATGAVRYASPAYCQITGLDAELLRGIDRSRLLGELASQCSPGAARVELEAWSRPGGAIDSTRVLQLDLERPARRVLQLKLQRGESASVSQVLHLRDITHESEVDQMKSEFVSTAAHELRTPMASIFGFTELMMTRELKPERRKEMLDTVYQQSKAMIRILDELLDLARIESRRGKDFVLEPVLLDDLVDEAVGQFSPPGGRPPPQVEPGVGRCLVHADRHKLAQVLRNLLSNAYKYSPQGGAVTVRVLARQVEVAGGQLRQEWGLQIEDHGIGLSPEQLARVCERFYRADASGAIPGTGLGMSIVKEIIELLGGALELSSQPGVGTVVSAWLPDASSRFGLRAPA